MDRSGQNVEYGTLAEQSDESHFDSRSDASNDLEKGHLKFPQDKLYGRDEELEELHNVFQTFESGEPEGQVVFLGGYSGIGKSSLVIEFAKQIEEKGDQCCFLSGKYSQLNAGQPFSAITQALNQYIGQFTKTASSDEITKLRSRLSEVDISPSSDSAAALEGTLISSLGELFKSKHAQSDEEVQSRRKSQGMGHDMNLIKYSFQNFFGALATRICPIIFFIDDLQWADEASLHLLSSFLKDKSLENVLFLGAYRQNEINDGHQLSKFIKDVELKKTLTRRLDISNLSPDSVARFIADSTGREPDEIRPVTEAVYSKTLGNIFFVKQALEELVRRNALFYDVILFEWQFGDVTKVELQGFLSKDVVEMVRSKLKALPKTLQKALSIFAFVNNTIDTDLLVELLQTECSKVNVKFVRSMMKTAVKEGIVLEINDACCDENANFGRIYRFSHDRIKEAACASIPEGDQRHHLLLTTSQVLLTVGSRREENWMLFTAAQHLNSIPVSYVDPIQLSELNLRVGMIATSGGAIAEAVVFYRAGVACLDSTSRWKDRYQLCLNLTNSLAEAEECLGHDDTALELAEEILANCRGLVDMSTAHYVAIKAASKNNSSYCSAVERAISILKAYDIHIPTMPSDRQVRREKFCVKLALRGRNLMCLAAFPIATDETWIACMRIAQMAMRLANMGKLPSVSAMLGYRMLRESLSRRMVTKDFACMLVFTGMAMRRQEKYEGAFSFANVAISLMARFSDERGLEYATAKMVLFGSLSCLRLPFCDAIESFLDLNKLLLSKGHIDMGLGAAMLSIYAFLNASLPLNTLIESKIKLFEQTSSNLGRRTFVAVFALLLQCIYNLTGNPLSSSNPTELAGQAFNEEKTLSSLEGDARKMTVRDISIARLMLAVIYNDETVMNQMLKTLDQYPSFDLPIERQHVRMSYVGFASLMLLMKKGAKTSRFAAKWAMISYKFFAKLSKFGSPNAQPVYACLKALKKPSTAAFDEAIQVCSSSGLLNLAGFMNEQCGLMLLHRHDQNLSKGSINTHQDYLKCAVWFYHDWGAMGKVKQLQSRFHFLQSAIQEKAPSHVSLLAKQRAKLIVPESIVLKGLTGIPRSVPLSDIH